MAFTQLRKHQLIDLIIDDSKIAADADIQQSKILNLETDLNNKLSLSGGAMTGDLILNADPTDPLGAATKQYVDNGGNNFKDFKLIYNDASTLIVEAGSILSDDESMVLTLDTNVIPDLSISGPNGRDTDPEQNNALYYVMVIGSTTDNLTYPTATFLTTEPWNPVLPTGYDAWKIVGAVYNDVSGDIVPFTHFPENKIFYYQNSQEISTVSNASWFDYVINQAPVIATLGIFNFISIGNSVTATTIYAAKGFSYSGSWVTGQGHPIAAVKNDTASLNTNQIIIPFEEQNIQLAATSTDHSTTINFVGYYYTLGPLVAPL